MNQHPQNKPAVPINEPSEQNQPPQAPQPKLRTAEEIAFTAKELERNISRLSQNAPPSPSTPLSNNQPANNYDALGYASISLSSSREAEIEPTPKNEPAPKEPIENTPNVDPYIDPSELTKPVSSSFRQNDPDQFSPESEIQSSAATSPQEAVSTLHDVHDNTTQSEALAELTSPDQAIHFSSEDHKNMQIHEELPPATWFSDPLSIITPRNPAPPQPQPVATDLKPEPSEPLFDIRNFSDSASRKIELIRGAYQADSESQTIQTPPPAPQSVVDSNTQTSKAEDIFDKDEVFLARTGDVIEVNGEDGFDRIDLACYDINCASISSNKIRIDDEQTGSFEIHFIDVDYAIFANGIKIRLNSTH